MRRERMHTQEQQDLQFARDMAVREARSQESLMLEQGTQPPRPRQEVQRQALYAVGQVASSGVELYERQQQAARARARAIEAAAEADLADKAVKEADWGAANQDTIYGAQLAKVRNWASASPEHQVGTRHKSALEQASAIPEEVMAYCKPASAKPVLQPPQRWKINDAEVRDPVPFLRDVFRFAVLTGQDAIMALQDAVEKPMQEAVRQIMAQSPPSADMAVRWAMGL